MEFILKILTSNENIYVDSKKDNEIFYELININKEILQNAFKLEANLHLSTKEAFSLQEIIEIIESLYKHGMDNVENIKAIIKYFYDESILIFEVEIDENKRDKLFEHFEKFFIFLENLLGSKDSYNKLISTIFQAEYLKISNNYFRNKLLNIIIQKNEFILNCYPLLKQLLKRIKISVNPKDMEKNLEIIKGNQDPIIGILNKNKSEILEQIILQILEHMLSEFFDEVEKENKIAVEKNKKQKDKDEKDYQKILNSKSPLNVFEQCVNELRDQKEENKDTKSNLAKLYSIAFIKIYLNKLLQTFNIYEDHEISIILDKIYDESNTSKIIRIYFLKLIYNFHHRNWEESFELNDYKFLEDKGFKTILDDYNKSDSEDNSKYYLLDYFIPCDMEDSTKLKEETNKFVLKIKDIQNKGDTDDTKDEKVENIDLFLAISINKIISNLFLKNYLDNPEGNENYKSLCNYYKKHLGNNNAKKLLDLFFDQDKFFKILKPKFESQKNNITLKGDPYESLLYGLRFCVQSLLKSNNDKFIYSSILGEDCFGLIKGSFIPGNNIPKNKKLESFKILEGILIDSPADTGNYVCSCGYYYAIGPCGFPTEDYTSTCPICNLKIGYGEKVIKNRGASNHGMIIRPGHYRIFRDEMQKREQMSRWDDPDENIPNKTLAQYKKEVIEPLFNSCEKGILQLSKEDYLDKNKTVRNISKISYRLLNFVLFNHLFFANCLNYISDEDLKNNFLIKDMNCLEIIQTNWNLLQEALQEKNIPSIQSFMNLIFKEFSELLSNCMILEELNELFKFEQNVENLVQSCLNQYPDYYNKYIQLNKEITSINETNIRIIINETFPPSEKIYPEKDYPLLKYFIYTEYQTNFIDVLKLEEDYASKYPLLYKYLNLTEEQKLIKYLPDFNDFTNSMVETYSYQITREKAKKTKLKDDEGFDPNKFKLFENSWNHIYKKATKFKCRDPMEPKKLTSEDTLIYFLNDDNELGYGMYLAAACQNFISWQNEFLKPIIDSSKFNGNLRYYIENMKKKIPVQEANSNQILSFDDCFKNSSYKDFDDLLYTFTKRDIYDKDQINYQRYNKFKFDFAMIEEELGKLILPEKCLFENEDKLNFVIFWGEGFRGGQSEIIQKFYEKYPQVDLNEEERKKIFYDIHSICNKELNYNFITFFGSMQILIFYLGNNNFAPDTDLKSIIADKPEYLKIDDKCINFIQDNNFKLNQFMNIFFYAEHLSFQELTKTLNAEYKKPIEEKVELDIKKKLEIKKEDDKIPWKQLAAVVRRFISRYLVGDRQTIDIDEKQSLTFQLSRIDLWEEKFGKLEKLDELIQEKINQFKLTVGQAYNFYEIIGKEDKNSILSDKKMREKEKEEGENKEKDIEKINEKKTELNLFEDNELDNSEDSEEIQQEEANDLINN